MGPGRWCVRGPACPHLFQDSKLAPATPEQVEENGLCTHCEKEIRGEGRRYFDDLEDAFRHFGHRTDEARRPIREALDGVQHDKVWIPASESYIALGDDGTGTAWIGKGYVQVKGRPVVELPCFQERGDGGARRGTRPVGSCARSTSSSGPWSARARCATEWGHAPSRR